MQNREWCAILPAAVHTNKRPLGPVLIQEAPAPPKKTRDIMPHSTQKREQIRLTPAALNLLLAIHRAPTPPTRAALRKTTGYGTNSALDRPLGRLFAANLLAPTKTLTLTPTGATLARALELVLANPRPSRLERAIAQLPEATRETTLAVEAATATPPTQPDRTRRR